ncbi:MAG: hypothetical protein HY902_19180 [Deltaproteobacteria bacterium]|nr:hypothetical protein [Deltaproteobacteria bacterium]
MRGFGLHAFVGILMMSGGLLLNQGLAAAAEKAPADKAEGAEPAKSTKPTKGDKKAKAGDKSGDKAAEKPSEAPADKAEKAEKTEKAEEGGASAVAEADVKLGPFQAPPRPFPFPLLGDDRAREVFVDRAGNLYKERPYSGNVPDWNAAPPAAAGGRCKVEPQSLTWVGFQNNADGSRVYVQVEKGACGYVYRPDDLHVVIDLPQVTVPSDNFKREILTGAFPTAIEQVRAEEISGKGTRIVIVLREHRPYLSAHLGKYLFVDVTR